MIEKGSEKWNSIMEKVRKLLALGTSPNSNEASAAMEKAGKLMAEYNIHLSEAIQNDKKGNTMCKEIASMGYGKYSSRFVSVAWQMDLANYIVKAFECVTIIHTGILRTDPKTGAYFEGFKIIFLGLYADCETSLWFYEYIRRWIQFKATERGGKKSSQDSFCIGAAKEVGDRINQMYMKMREEIKLSGCTDLVIIKKDAIAEYKKEKYGKKLRNINLNRNIGDEISYQAGREEGKKIPLHKQVAA